MIDWSVTYFLSNQGAFYFICLCLSGRGLKLTAKFNNVFNLSDFTDFFNVLLRFMFTLGPVCCTSWFAPWAWGQQLCKFNWGNIVLIPVPFFRSCLALGVQVPGQMVTLTSFNAPRTVYDCICTINTFWSLFTLCKPNGHWHLLLSEGVKGAVWDNMLIHWIALKWFSLNTFIAYTIVLTWTNLDQDFISRMTMVALPLLCVCQTKWSRL